MIAGDAAPTPLTVSDWMARDLPEPDWLLGNVISTTTRASLSAPTGLGKTNFSMALAISVAAGKHFLHWKAKKPAGVLYIDGEMSRRLLKQRIADAARRLGAIPDTFYALSHEDIEGFALSTHGGPTQNREAYKSSRRCRLYRVRTQSCAFWWATPKTRRPGRLLCRG